MKKNFTLDVPVNSQNDQVYGKGKKNLMFQMRACLCPRIRCREKLWFLLQSFGTVPQTTFFVNENGNKVNKENYCKC